MRGTTGQMTRRIRLDVALAVVLVTACVTAAAAVTTLSTGVKFLAGGKAFQTGYLTGAVDLLATLQDAGFLAAERQDEAKRLIRCGNTIKVEDLRTAMMQHFEKTPVQTNNNAASTFYVVLRARCR